MPKEAFKRKITLLTNKLKIELRKKFVGYVQRVIKSRRLRWAWHVSRMEEGRTALNIFTGKPTGKRFLGRPRRRWEDNIQWVSKK